ncbi:MAG: methyltransferase domain-containing protein [Acidobacteria bacterium]|nr:methyltransferase domain-containing protein [Acidobacteriota bacterium]NIM63732.1 methyltransferase domain-containing protein [Acidobacteriota bacterium]NIO60117.1 methyltransferase domain-containing protein [Acidobacteriota bacterium]NIQ31188.1 methyltransferase domain-containing protein [Acidobacteriota bacterium]NIQ86317.1 methyltransferase domain-containing protein [Acidobacteriota bacterium]
MLSRLFRKPSPNTDVPLPPRKLVRAVGGGDFAAIGEEFFPYFTDLARLQPHESVLDIGCGCGRMAVPLTLHLNASGSYDGFDIQTPGIRWCRKNVTPRYPNFRFQVADVYNKKYNPKGQHQPGEYRFPYDDDSFDFVFLTSVFTHMLRADMEHYVDEIVRVMRPTGRCLITCFLLNDESRALIKDDKSTLTFDYVVEHTAVHRTSVPEAAVAFDEMAMIEVLEDRDLTIDKPIRYGSWCGREDYLSYQDILLARPTRA